MKKLYIRWNDVDWTLVKSTIFEWQRAIYSASKAGDVRTVRKYQHRILGSMDAKLLAVRRAFACEARSLASFRAVGRGARSLRRKLLSER